MHHRDRFQDDTEFFAEKCLLKKNACGPQPAPPTPAPTSTDASTSGTDAKEPPKGGATEVQLSAALLLGLGYVLLADGLFARSSLLALGLSEVLVLCSCTTKEPVNLFDERE